MYSAEVNAKKGYGLSNYAATADYLFSPFLSRDQAGRLRHQFIGNATWFRISGARCLSIGAIDHYHTPDFFDYIKTLFQDFGDTEMPSFRDGKRKYVSLRLYLYALFYA